MPPFNNSEIEKELATLQTVFKSALPAKIEKIVSSWQLVLSSESDADIAECHRLVHSLVGTAGTYGAMSVSTYARELEQRLNLLRIKQNSVADEKTQIKDLIEKIKVKAADWQPKKDFFLHSELDEQSKRNGNLIYLVEDDELLAADIIHKLEKYDFEVKHFNKPEQFIAAFHEEKPSAIIMDLVFEAGDLAGLEVIEKLKKEHEDFPPFIIISYRKDIEARLVAAHAGAHRYFNKPLNMDKLSKTLDTLIERNIAETYRVLIVDDEVEILKYYETVLSYADIEVKTVSDPMQTLSVLEEFKPDVIVLDVYMPKCSGADLAQVIRQDDRWVLTPIMFLSSEKDVNTQLDIMSLGAESFLVKPVEAEQLIAAVTVKAKNSRWRYRFNNDLKLTLRESEFQSITFNNHNIASTADVTGKIINVNEKFCFISGYSEEELIGKNHRILKSKHHPDSFYKEMWQSISNGKVWHGVICNINKAGEEYWVDSTIVPFLDEKGKPYKYVSARTDVTELLESKSRLERSQKFAKVGTWDWNIEKGDLYWSDNIWQLFGYNKQVTETTYDNFIAAIHPDDRKLVIDAITKCVDDGNDYNIEHRIVWQDGSHHWVKESGNVLRDKDNNPVRMLGLVQDITESKKTQEALILATKEAEDANRAKSAFLSSMSHELRTPMNAIMGFGKLLEIDSDLNKNQQQSINEILKASEHLLTLINEVLDLAKIEAGKIELSIENIQLSVAIIESLQLIYPLAEKRSISIVILKDNNEISLNDLVNDPVSLRADHTRLKQVIINLLSNAVKYNVVGGSIAIKISTNANKDCVRINVIDTGIGMSLENKRNLFVSFNRLGAENTDVEGTGIGLVITKNVIELMGGRIGVETEPGKGSDFWFDLPAAEKPKAASVDQKSVSFNINTEYSVLYIEDNPANLRLVTQLLARFPNVHMWSTHDPKLGIELSIEHNPDLILLDINLPGMDGYEVLEILRKNDLTCNTPVVAVSANAMKSDIEKGLSAGFDDYITKPINIQYMLSVLETMITNKNRD